MAYVGLRGLGEEIDFYFHVPSYGGSRPFMVSEFGIAILPDLLANDLDLVIVGAGAGRASAR